MTPSHFDILLSRNVPHILESIFFSLDYESFKECFAVSKTWHTLFKSEMYQKKAKSLFHDEILWDEQRRQRRMWLEKELLRCNVKDPDMCEQLRNVLQRKETNYLRMKRAGLGKSSSFEEISSFLRGTLLLKSSSK